MKKLLVILLLILGGKTVRAQAMLRASDAYNYLQGQRDRVRTVVGEAAQPAPDSLRKGIRILQEALVYYQRPEIQVLAKTSESLYYRKTDILFDMAILQGQLGQPEVAAASLQQLLTPETAQVYAPWIIKEPALAAARQAPPVKVALEEALALNNVFNSKALATPYQPNLSPAEKAAGLSKLWMEAKYNFAYFDHIPALDWDQTYLNYLARVQATTSTVAYFRMLQEFYAQLHDGHTGVSATNGPLADSVYGRPPFLAQLVAGRVLVQLVRNDSLQRTGIVPGLELVRVDGLPVIEYADRYVRPYQSGSTPQNVDVQTYTYNLLRGSKLRPVRVEFRDARGRSFTRVLPRGGYSKLKPIAPVRLRFLPGNVAYLQVNEFETDAGLRRFVAAFDSIKATNALIIDLRQNGGGNSSNGWRILNYLTDKPYLLGRYASRTYSAVGRARGDGVRFEPVDTANYSSPAGGSNYYAKPVAVLIGGATFSAAEDFCAAYVGLKRGPLVGEPTGGSTGQPLSFVLPGGIMARVCTKRDMYPDGTEWNGKGIMPTVLVRPTVAELAAGHDPVLAAALRQLHAPTAAANAAKPPHRQK